jgi:hypothetical protein
MSTHARPLADRLATTSDEQLIRLFAARGVRADPGWNDFFDAAEALLEPASVARALPHLTAAQASALLSARDRGDAGDERASLDALALLDSDGSPWPTVAAALDGRPDPTPTTATPLAPASADAAAHAAERAFTTVSVLADLLMLSREAPFALVAGGDVSAAEKRQLGDAGLPVDLVDPLISVAIAAGLAVPEERRLRVTDTADEWLRSPVADRWARLATAFRDMLPEGLRSDDGGWVPPQSWPAAHPWDPAWPDRSRALRENARLLGLITEDDSEPAWAVPLRSGAAADASALTDLLPTEVDRIFLQNDLTAIAPGPLAPALDVRLRTMAARESASQASSYRFTAETVARAFVLGETEAGLLEFLERISLTGIPQPLAYLITRTAQRHGLVRVFAAEGGGTRIESTDAHLIQAMSIDQNLRPLGLMSETDALVTHVSQETVYWALTDARYPATLIGSDGAAVAGDRRPPAGRASAVRPDIDYAPLIARLRARQGPDADAAWLDRELEAAVRARAVIRVTVGMPDGSTRELLLEATGLGGGRLRGRDRAADVERTLPVSSIRAASVESV